MRMQEGRRENDFAMSITRQRASHPTVMTEKIEHVGTDIGKVWVNVVEGACESCPLFVSNSL